MRLLLQWRGDGELPLVDDDFCFRNQGLRRVLFVW